MLIGASKDDNLFQQRELKAHLEEIHEAGGNYVRNTMSSRDVGGGNEVRAFKKNADGMYDLLNFNPEYWNRLDSLLEWTLELGIFVQVEIWATHDHFPDSRWKKDPWNPENNTNYSFLDTQLDSVVPEKPNKKHPFFNSVPGANNDSILLFYQEKFAQEILKRTLKFDHVLYCITNEIQHAQSPEWSWYWADFIQKYFSGNGKKTEVTEMYWAPDMRDDQHKYSLDHPEFYTFFEASQNSAVSGQKNWDNLQYIREYLADDPRPINSVKIYGKSGEEKWPGTDDEAIDRFWRNLLGGCASSRFHRNESGKYGLGFSPKSIFSLKAAKWLLEEMHPWESSPCMELITDREENEVYACSDDNKICMYFPAEGNILIDLRMFSKKTSLEWVNVSTGERVVQKIESTDLSRIKTPPGTHWLGIID